MQTKLHKKAVWFLTLYAKWVAKTYDITYNLLANKDKIQVVCAIDGKLTVRETTIVLVDDVYCVRFTANNFLPYTMVVDTANAQAI